MQQCVFSAFKMHSVLCIRLCLLHDCKTWSTQSNYDARGKGQGIQLPFKQISLNETVDVPGMPTHTLRIHLG